MTMSRAFIIGNGPSLNLTPLDRLRDEFTIGMNRFDLLGLDWDPDWWMMADAHYHDEWWELENLFSRRSAFMVRQPLKEYLVDKYPDLLYMDYCKDIGGQYIPSAWHLPTLCTHGGGIGWALQLAVMLGHNPIYLLGCDLYKYRGPDDGDVNHFDPDYSSYRVSKIDGKEAVGPAQWENINETMRVTHRIAQRECSERGIELYNATVGGALEEHPRADIWDLLSGN